TERMYRSPSLYSCHGRTGVNSVWAPCGGRKPRPGRNSREMQNADTRNDIAFAKNAHLYPNCATLAPPRNVPIVSVVHPVVWVNEFAVCNSSRVAIDGRIAARPAVKKGDAVMRRPLRT